MMERFPCPFCGVIPDEPFHAGYTEGIMTWRIECKNKDCHMIVVGFHPDKEKAVTKWNTRSNLLDNNTIDL